MAQEFHITLLHICSRFITNDNVDFYVLDQARPQHSVPENFQDCPLVASPPSLLPYLSYVRYDLPIYYGGVWGGPSIGTSAHVYLESLKLPTSPLLDEYILNICLCSILYLPFIKMIFLLKPFEGKCTSSKYNFKYFLFIYSLSFRVRRLNGRYLTLFVFMSPNSTSFDPPLS